MKTEDVKFKLALTVLCAYLLTWMAVQSLRERLEHRHQT